MKGNQEQPAVRHSLVFQRLEERDLYKDQVLKQMSRQPRHQAKTPAAEAQGAVQEAPAQKRVITKVTVLETSLKDKTIEAVAFKVDMDPPPEEHHLAEVAGKVDVLKLTITREQWDTGRVKAIVSEFSTTHNIFKAEATSLYRLVKALLDRKHVKEEADLFIQEIDRLDFDKHAAGELQGFRAVTVAELTGESSQLQVNLALEDTKKHIRSRLGDSSSFGAFLVRGLLEHNIDRKKAINKHLALQRFAAHEAHQDEERANLEGLDGGRSATGRRRRNLAPKIRSGKTNPSSPSSLAALPAP